ncbi:uncharacterized protein AB675_9827 [Cyphellophora attinorum]|uniref:Uncharacterized protein n=1 Tax=Cyphellophora attinorum TaxID=1664694 RepID=A0A0N0NP94_9EURO|nr:uncharacterized protein AB675_9827 [Phialophora attinorum]KPI42491.1 hypothetical protein AB675_9827 [Phialophora attinorum]
MWPLRSASRHTLIVFLTLVILLSTSLPSVVRFSSAFLHNVLDNFVDEGQEVNSSSSSDNLHERYITSQKSTLPTFNPYLKPLLQCQNQSNERSQIVLPARHLNISLQLDNDETTTAQNRYFNPTIIPLPSYAASLTSARYVLVTRLVTAGLHQESHACLASFCHPGPENDGPNSTTQRGHLPPDSEVCSDSALAHLGPNGGFRCITLPRPVNIPPTPSLKCSPKWAAFPDIPGFHDPRIMWSGDGEPLIIVNSGSTYGCVGLWMQDLRTLIPELRDVMERRKPAESPVVPEDGKLKKRTGGGGEWREQGTPWWKMPVLKYETLTELTRWQGRSEVEKNWILWWPGGNRRGQTWVSYEMFGQWEEDEEDLQKHAMQMVGLGGDDMAQHKLDASNDAETDQVANALLREGFWSYWPSTNASQSLHDASTDHYQLDSESTPPSMPDTPTSAESATVPTTEKISSINTVSVVSEATPSSTAVAPQQPIKRSEASADADEQQPPTNYTFHSGRAISELLYVSYSTIALPNVTHPDEPPCLLPPDMLSSLQSQSQSSSRARRASTHQSTPALRLILCPSRSSCLGTEQEWLDTGREVHFSIVHRKLHPVNALGLVERGGYERWVVIWEGRSPGRIVATGKHAVVFQGEVFDEGRDEKEMGFVYTTSVSWAWRVESNAGRSDKEEDEDESDFAFLDGDMPHLSGLGTGFLDDEVILGIGIDDVRQAVVRVKVEELLACLTLCPGISIDDAGTEDA